MAINRMWGEAGGMDDLTTIRRAIERAWVTPVLDCKKPLAFTWSAAFSAKEGSEVGRCSAFV